MDQMHVFCALRHLCSKRLLKYESLVCHNLILCVCVGGGGGGRGGEK